MKRIRSAWIVPTILLTCGPAAAQERNPAPESQHDPNRHEFGILISEKVLGGILDQFVERMERQYNLEPEQMTELKELFRERVPKFLRENQNEATVVFNEFLDAWHKNEAPTPEHVAQWAQRALPLIEKAKVFIGDTSEAMKDHMSDEQVVKLDATMAAIDVGMTMGTKRLNDWAAGRYDPETEWHKNPRAREIDRKREREVQAAMEEARQARLREYGMEAEGNRIAPAGQPPAAKSTEPAAKAAVLPKDEWAKWVDAQIARWELDDEQKQKAQLHLNEAYAQRDKYLGSKSAIIDQLRKQFEHPKDKDELAVAEQKYQELMKPTERTFEKLKEKVEKLPRREQRARAAAREQQAEKPPAGAASGERAQKP
jgi:hypothetical protein